MNFSDRFDRQQSWEDSGDKVEKNGWHRSVSYIQYCTYEYSIQVSPKLLIRNYIAVDAVGSLGVDSGPARRAARPPEPGPENETPPIWNSSYMEYILVNNNLASQLW